MARLAVLIVIIAVVFTIYTFIDCIVTAGSRVRALPKPIWALIVIVLPVLGGILWLALGKERKNSTRSGAQRAPDDDPAFLRTLGNDKERDARIRDLEARLAELDDDHDDPKK